MKEDSQDDTAPLPRSWLPVPLPSAADPAWDDRVEGIMAAAAPELHSLARKRSTGAVRQWSGIEAWSVPAVAIAAASVALMLIVKGPKNLRDAPPGSIPLGLIAAGGNPAILWSSLGIEADPVLALIAVQEQQAPSGEATQSTPNGAVRR